VENPETVSNPTKLTELKPGMKLTGTIKKTEIFGAFVDVGVDTDGLLHISRLKKGHVNRVEDIVEPGQELDVFVHSVDSNAGRLELSLIKPVSLKWNAMKPGMQLKGSVVRLERFGAFVDIGAERPGLVHVSELSNDYVANPGDVVKVGEDVDVTIVDIDRKKRQIRLTMKEADFQLLVDEEEEEEEPIPTAMEVALRQALDEDVDAEGANEKAAEKSPASGNRDELEDILSRTLKHQAKSTSG